MHGAVQEEFEHAASLFLPAKQPETGHDDDMFGDDMFSDEPSKAAPALTGSKAPHLTTAEVTTSAPQEQPQPTSVASQPVTSAAPTVGPSSAEAVDYASWPIKELRRFLEERGQVLLHACPLFHAVHNLHALMWLLC